MRFLRSALLLAALAFLGGCESAQPILDPRGPAAGRIADLWWLMFWLSVGVFVAVVGLLLIALRRAGREREQAGQPPLGETGFVVAGGIVIPVAILMVVLFTTIDVGNAVSAPPSPPAVHIEIVGHQFWWEIRYPDQQVTTANELHIPVGQPVQLSLTGQDVIHSFWVPQLHGKQDTVPGARNELWIQADQPGIYRGQCTEYCGVQHALMALLVIAEPSEQFAAWLDRQRQPAAEPTDQLQRRGFQLFDETGCVLCHVVRGRREAGPTGTAGPDLTHLASRRTLAAVTMPNTPENLANWIVRPQEIKPGNRMPSSNFDGESLRALVAYLESLE